MKWLTVIVRFIFEILGLLSAQQREKKAQHEAERIKREQKTRETEKRIEERVNSVESPKFRPDDPMGVDDFNRGRKRRL